MKIALALMVICQHVFNAYATEKSVRWSIFYFVSHYLLLSVMSLLQVNKRNSREMAFYLSMFIGWLVLAVSFAFKWNMSYNEYLVSIDSLWMNISFTSIVVPLLIVSYYGKIQRLH